MITVGRMAREYGLLPSEVAQRASTYDIMVMDVVATYEQYQQQQQSGQINTDLYQYSTEEMTAMMEKARGTKLS